MRHNCTDGNVIITLSRDNIKDLMASLSEESSLNGIYTVNGNKTITIRAEENHIHYAVRLSK